MFYRLIGALQIRFVFVFCILSTTTISLQRVARTITPLLRGLLLVASRSGREPMRAKTRRVLARGARAESTTHCSLVFFLSQFNIPSCAELSVSVGGYFVQQLLSGRKDTGTVFATTPAATYDPVRFNPNFDVLSYCPGLL